MKGKINAKKTPERRWSNHRRVCDHYISRSWIRWSAGEHLAVRGSETDVARNGERRFNSSWPRLNSDSGAITAEFAVVLPVVILVLTTVLSITALQTERYQLIELAAMSARSIARGEGPETAKLLANDVNPEFLVSVEHQAHLVCVLAKKENVIFWLGRIPIEEKQCARKNGL